VLLAASLLVWLGVAASCASTTERRFTRPQHGFSTATAYALLGDAPKAYWWHSAQH
jgi:hypothetical protein